MSEKRNLLGCSLESLEDFFSNMGEPKFRAKQLLSWVHQKGILDYPDHEEMLNRIFQNGPNPHLEPLKEKIRSLINL